MPFGFKQRGEQRVLVFAVAVLIVKNVPGSVRLVTPQSQRKADIAEILRHEIVKRLNFVQLIVEALGELFGFGSNFRRRRAAVFVQSGIPAADLLPANESGQLNIGPLFVQSLLLFLFVFLLLLSFASSSRSRCELLQW